MSKEEKKSEQLLRQARMTEDDQKSWDLYFKSKREGRQEAFEEHILPILNKYYYVEDFEGNNMYRFEDEEFGRIDFFPKKDMYFSKLRGRWYNNGADFIVKSILELNS